MTNAARWLNVCYFSFDKIHGGLFARHLRGELSDKRAERTAMPISHGEMTTPRRPVLVNGPEPSTYPISLAKLEGERRSVVESICLAGFNKHLGSVDPVPR